MKKLKMVMGGALLALLAGCGSDKGMDFVGSWIEVDTKSTKPATLKITYDGEVFHVDEKKLIVGLPVENKLDGKAESDSTLSFMGDMTTMRLEGDKLQFEGKEFIKSP